MNVTTFLKLICDERGPILSAAADTVERMSQADLDELVTELKELVHHKDTTINLWATDRPDLISDPSKVLFQITAEEQLTAEMRISTTGTL